MSRRGVLTANRRAAFAVLALAVLVALAGCGSLGAEDNGELGVENGYSYDDDVAVTPGDGLNASELEAVKSRAMARLERVRGLEFTSDVPVRVVSRSQYRANQTVTTDGTHGLWNNQVWEGLFLVGEDRNVSAVFGELRGSTVQGYYDAGSDEIVVVSESEAARVDRGTLVHELVHALQDQHYVLNESMGTQDRQLAHSAVVEGEASLLTARYQERCDGTWSCVTVPTEGGGGSISNPGVFLVIYHPYASGPDFVASVESEGGWDAVGDLHEPYPASSEQVIHPERYPEDRPRNVTVPDRSAADWNRFDHDPVADTVGEASIYAMFVDNGVGETPSSRYSYEHPAANGWAGDALVPYRNGDRYGYVWETAWEDAGEARQFHDAYLALLEKHGAVDRGDGVYVVPDGPFADAFRVTREGDRVRIVNAPTVGELDDVHAR